MTRSRRSRYSKLDENVVAPAQSETESPSGAPLDAKSANQARQECPKRLAADDGDAITKALQRMRHRTSEGGDGKNGVDGVIQNIDLAPIKKHFGDAWPRLRAKASSILEQVIEHETRSGDHYIWRNDDEILLLRPNAKADRIKQDGEEIARSMTLRLCGFPRVDRFPTVRTMHLDLDGNVDGIDSVRDLEAILSRQEARDGHPDLCRHSHLVGDLQLRWRPTIHFKKGLVCAYQAVAQAKGKDGSTILVDDLPDDGDDGAMRAQIDRWLIERAHQLIADQVTPIRTGLILPLHIRTLTHRRFREPFLDTCRILPRPVRRRLVLQLLDVPSGMPQSRIHDLSTCIMPFCALIAIDQTRGWVDLENLDNTGISLLSLDAAKLGERSEAVMRVKELSERAEQGRLRGVLSNTGDIHLSHVAHRCGVHYFNGKSLMPAVTTPGRIIRIRQ